MPTCTQCGIQRSQGQSATCAACSFLMRLMRELGTGDGTGDGTCRDCGAGYFYARGQNTRARCTQCLASFRRARAQAKRTAERQAQQASPTVLVAPQPRPPLLARLLLSDEDDLPGTRPPEDQ